MYAEVRDLLVKASQLHEKGFLAEAKTLYHQVLTIDPHNFEAKRLLGVVYRQMGDPTAAIACLEHTLRDHKNLTDEQKALIWTHLSTAYYDLRRYTDAIQAAKQATALNPELANAWNNMGASLKEIGEAEEAIKAFKKALEILPGYSRAMNNLAEVYQESGQPEKAEKIYREILEKEPDHIGAVQGLATVLRSLGRQDEALSLLKKILAKYPENVDIIRSLAGFKTWKMGEKQRLKLKELVETPGFDPVRAETFMFLLAQDAEKRGELTEAAEWYRKGNSLKARRVHYNFHVIENLISKIKELFSDNFVKQVRAFWPEPTGMADPEWQPVFILGLPRSGTTLINQILASHPEINSVGELTTGFSRCMENLDVWKEYLAGNLDKNTVAENLLSNKIRYKISHEYREAQKRVGVFDGTVVDKLPGNFFYIPFIGLSIPRSRIILTKRNLRDVALSCFQQNFAHGQAFSFAWDRIHHFFALYRELINFYIKLFGDRFYIVSYEELVYNFETKARELVLFAGHEWSEKCLNFQTSDSVVRTASVDQVREPVYSDSVGRWKQYEDVFPELKEIPEE